MSDFDHDVDPVSKNCCGGPDHCENRKFDEKQEDCQSCLKETSLIGEY
jgi:hypothetical protein